jgi:hypothetical protein
MERGDSSKGSWASEEVDGPLATQRHRTDDDRAFAGSSHILNTGGLLCIAAVAQVSPSKLVVKEVEERAMADAVATDVEERADALIKQLEDADRHGIRTYSFPCF